MFKFELFLEKRLLREYFFDKKLSITIGRRPSHDIHIEHMGVSADHAKIHFFPAYLLEDLGSKNGTTLNGQHIGRTAKLNHGDIIGITQYRLRFTDEKKMAETSDTWEKDAPLSTWAIDFPHGDTSKKNLEKGDETLPSLKMAPREFECLYWLSRGKNTGEISQALNISESSVNSHIANLCKKLGAANQAEAIALAISSKLIDPDFTQVFGAEPLTD